MGGRKGVHHQGVVRITVRYMHVKEWDTDQIVELYKAGSWWRAGYDSCGIPALMRGSFDFVVAVDEEEGVAVGMGRTISDGVSDAYIQDVVVFPDRRGEGIGKGIVSGLLEYARSRGLEWIGLVAEKDSMGFYEPLGFKEFKGTPMLFEEEE